jgi:hypothetical protein
MAIPSGEIAVTGSVTVTSRVNVRQGLPSTSATVLRKPLPGTQLHVAAISAGEEVQGNRLWFRLADQHYVWSGACSALSQGEIPIAPLLTEIAVPIAAPAAGPFPTANVIDIYHGDEVSSFAAARASGVIGVIHKATTGGTGRDDLYDDRRTAAVAAGLLWGAYHWGTGADPKKQVENFLSWAKPDDKTLVALDYELTPSNQMSIEQAREFLERIEEKLGRKAVLYSGSTLKDALKSTVDPYLGSHRLWLAQYGPTPEVLASWPNYWLWQFTEGKAADPRRRKIPGIPGNSRGELDCDHYAGTPEQLAAEWAS